MTDTTPSLEDIRSQIDRIDCQIIGLIAERQGWVVEAGKLKKDEAGVRAPARVEQVITKVRELAIQQGASPDVVEKAYRALIAGFIEFELEVHRNKGN
ncbi:MAG: chorismate mutase [Microbacteriaceae bacterium]